MGTATNNPAFDIREYEIELEDGTTNRMFANRIAANLYSQVDNEGRQILTSRETVGHEENDAAISRDQGYTVTVSGYRKPENNSWMESRSRIPRRNHDLDEHEKCQRGKSH